MFGAFEPCSLTEDLAHLCSMLSRQVLMVQAAVVDGQFLDLLFLFDDGRSLSKWVLPVCTTFPTYPDMLFRHSLHKRVHHTLARL